MTKSIARVGAAWAMFGLLLFGAMQVHGNGATPGNTSTDKFVYIPAVQVAIPPCDTGAIAKLRSATTWHGQYSITFKGNASGTWPGGDSEVVSVDRVMRLDTLVLTKTTDTATFVQWKVGQLISTGQLTVNDSDVYTFKIGGNVVKTAQFTEKASTDVLSIELYPQQCKLRFSLDGFTVGPVTGSLTPNDEFEFCAEVDVKSPKVGAQSFAASVPIFVSGADVGSYADARRAGLRCRVGGGDPKVGPDLFTPKLAWVLDGGTTSGARGKGDSALGNAQVTFSFTPQP